MHGIWVKLPLFDGIHFGLSFWPSWIFWIFLIFWIFRAIWIFWNFKKVLLALEDSLQTSILVEIRIAHLNNRFNNQKSFFNVFWPFYKEYSWGQISQNPLFHGWDMGQVAIIWWYPFWTFFLTSDPSSVCNNINTTRHAFPREGSYEGFLSIDFWCHPS